MSTRIVVGFIGHGIHSVYHLSWIAKPIRASFLLVPIASCVFVGCVDGPFFELKKLNPVIQNQWKEDRKRGPVFSQRVEEMRLLRAQLPRMPEQEQDKWIATISQIVESESSPELRREAVLALSGAIERPEAATTLIKLARDKNDKVRLAVANSLHQSVTPDATKTLLALASNDASESVRSAATQSLGTHKTEEVKLFLAKQISDRRPGVQYPATLALKELTGKDFKGDVSKWKRYLNGEEVEPDKATFYEALQPYNPFRR